MKEAVFGVGETVIRKTTTLIFMAVALFFVHPAYQSYDFNDGLNKSYAEEWLNLYILPNYDTSKIEQVESTQSHSVEYRMDAPVSLEDDEVIATAGSEYEGEFHILNDDDAFHMLLINDGRVTGLYTNSDEVSINSVSIQNMDRPLIREVYGEPVKTVDKGDKRLVVENSEYDVFEINDIYVFFFYDLHEDDKVNGLLTVKKSEMRHAESMYNHPSVSDNEQVNFHLINASRVKYGFESLEYDEDVGEAAGLHSTDMSDNGYFSHVSPDGGTLKERIEKQEIPYSLAGENIATGHTSPIFSHHSLLNSKEHRVNTLNDSYSHIGIGVDYDFEDVPYYTENYVKK